MILLQRFLLLFIVPVMLCSCNVYYRSDSQIKKISKDVSFLSSDDLMGRFPGSEGDSKAGDYIENQFRKLNFTHNKQAFPFFSGYEKGRNNSFRINDTLVKDSLYEPRVFSADTAVNALVVFCGYGLQVKTDSGSWDDYKGIDVKGKWVLVLTGYPDFPEYSDAFSTSAGDRDKALLAADQGAAGILLVSSYTDKEEDALPGIYGRQARTGIAAIHISRKLADKIVSNSGKSIKELETDILTKLSFAGFYTSVNVAARTDLEELRGFTSNRYGVLMGNNPTLKNQCIVIGAHFDHLGIGGLFSSSRTPDTIAIHNGADDNASGVSLMLDLARKLKKDRLARSVVFVAFGAEELGLLGSKYFIGNYPVDSEKVILMINLDMVGRLDTTRGLRISGTGTFAGADSLLLKANKYGLKQVMSPEGSGPSDHSSFYAAGIPVIFITTGAHTDYHTPNDDETFIQYKGMSAISNFVLDFVKSVDSLEKAPAFKESARKEAEKTGYSFKVTLGFMPDFSNPDIEGVRVEFVTKGKAAERGGVKNGDIITAIDGYAIKNIYDYMYRLGKLSKNQIISLELLRNGKKEVLLIQL